MGRWKKHKGDWVVRLGPMASPPSSQIQIALSVKLNVEEMTRELSAEQIAAVMTGMGQLIAAK